MPGPAFAAALAPGLGLRETVVLVHAGIEYHVNRLMIARLGTSALESAKMNAKLAALEESGAIDGRLRKDLIQAARLRHHFAHRLEPGGEFEGLLAELGGRGGGLRERYLGAVMPACEQLEGIAGTKAGPTEAP